MKPSIFSRLLVALQLGLVAFLAASGSLVPLNRAFLLLQAAGIALGLWAWHAMRHTRFRICPEPAQRIDFVNRGPYRWIRHPMYACVILLTAGWLFDAPAESRIAAWSLLLVVLGVKIHLEERMLMKFFPRYWHYRRATKMLVPFLF